MSDTRVASCVSIIEGEGEVEGDVDEGIDGFKGSAIEDDMIYKTLNKKILIGGGYEFKRNEIYK